MGPVLPGLILEPVLPDLVLAPDKCVCGFGVGVFSGVGRFYAILFLFDVPKYLFYN